MAIKPSVITPDASGCHIEEKEAESTNSEAEIHICKLAMRC
jgi:hypothetical protein